MAGHDFRPVLDKRDFSVRYAAGEFGNCSPTYQTPNELLSLSPLFPLDAPVPGLFHLRNRVAGGVTYYNQRWSECVARWCDMPDHGQWYASKMIPPEVECTLRLQGEVYRSTRGLDLFYSRVAKPMRVALAERAEQVCGTTALLLLRGNLCPNSWDWMETLLDRYHGHVVEFSCYDRPWGTLYPLYNTIFWEVRAY